MWTASYQNQKNGGNGYDLVKGTSKYRIFDLTGQWQPFFMETVKTGVPTERVAVGLEVRSAGNIADLDEVYVAPFFEKKQQRTETYREKQVTLQERTAKKKGK